ncbi:DUF6776 family protein [Metapseudomonas otitidis]|uniref:DUF6776 family protein n=1 Tax=Metapseudomonas otitidis TaxID=319939 RepID=UPI001F1168C6|nr:DUF6776 family protein [Pseudomonas otitidis]
MASWEVRVSDPRRERLLRLVLCALVLALPASFFAGGWQQAERSREVVEQRDQLLQENQQQARELEQLRQRQAVLESGERLGQQANEQSRQAIKMMEEQVFALQQELAVYKGVLAPDRQADGLRIRALEVHGTDMPSRYRMRLMLSRVGKDERALAGALSIRILGRQGNKETALLLADLAKDLPKGGVPFSFKYFQAIPDAGRFIELELPEGFVPRRIEVSARVEGQREPLLRTFDWTDEES